MSKFSDKLASLGQTAPARLGFGKASARDRTPVMLLVGRSRAERDIKGLVDVLLLPFAAAGKGDSLWGMSVANGTKLDIEDLKNKDCQFVLIEDDDSPASLLGDEDLCRGLIVPAGLPDQKIRAIEDAPFEFLLYRPDAVSWPLSIRSALLLQEVISSFSKHIFLELPEPPRAEDLEVLKQMPVSALVVDLDKTPEQSVRDLKAAIAKLEPRKHRPERTPLVPAAGRNSADYDEDDYDDDGWDDDD